MAKTYLEIVNEVLGDLNEVRLTSANFSNARNIQLVVKEAVNRAYRDIHSEEYKWPWMAATNSQDEYYGNTSVETVAGTRWYLLNPTATNYDEDYEQIDWDRFTLTEEGVAGKTAPYTVKKLKTTSIEDWRDYLSASEERDKSGSQTYGVPTRVIRNPDGRRFGLSPIPDGVYKIYFYAWQQLTELSAFDDETVLPSRYVPTLIAKARYYAWQFKENPQQASMALDDYKKGLRRMREAFAPLPDEITDDRVRFV